MIKNRAEIVYLILKELCEKLLAIKINEKNLGCAPQNEQHF